MKLLVITSEPLNPDNILTSTFELTQAILLKRIADVAILSVSPPRSLPAESRRWLAGHSSLKKYVSFVRSLVGGKRKTNKYFIEGIAVYEGNNFKYYSKRNWKDELHDWTRAGYAAFRHYVKDNGCPNIVHAHGRFINAGALAVKILQQKNIPFIYTEHSTVYQTGMAPAAAKDSLDTIIRKASVVISVSSALRNHMEVFLGRKLPGVVVQPNVLDPVFELPVSEFNLITPFHFIAIASLHKKKGLALLIRAFKENFSSDERYSLTICGDGPLRSELETLAFEDGPGRKIVFTGNISKVEIRQRIDQSHVFISPSLQETFGVAVIESLSRGCPVIATRSGGPEAIVGKDDGILVNAGSAEEIGEAIKMMIGSYFTYDRAGIRERAISRFGSEAFLARARQLYAPAIEKTA